jgi:hypothetical protein
LEGKQKQHLFFVHGPDGDGTTAALRCARLLSVMPGPVDIGLKTSTVFFILLHVEEKEPDFIEYGARNNIQLH